MSTHTHWRRNSQLYKQRSRWRRPLHELCEQLFLLSREIATNAVSAVTPAPDTQRLLPKRAARLPPLPKKKETHTQEQHMCLAPKRKTNMRRTCCSLNTRAVAQSSCCNYRMPMCIGSFSYTLGSPKVIPNSSVSSDVRRTWPTEREQTVSSKTGTWFNLNMSKQSTLIKGRRAKWMEKCGTCHQRNLTRRSSNEILSKDYGLKLKNKYHLWMCMDESFTIRSIKMQFVCI